MTLGQPVEVRRIVADEWQSFKTVRLAALAESPAAFGSTLERELAFGDDVWKERADAGSSNVDRAMFLAWGGDEPIGIVGGIREHDGHLELVSMWVAPSARRIGLGEQLVAAVVGFADDTSTDRVELWVVRGNDGAQRLYERCGFVVTGDFQPMPRDPCAEEVRMRFSRSRAGRR